MANRPLFSGTPTVEVDQNRYDELVAAEERLYILETAIKNCNFYNAEFEVLKKLFELDKKIDVTPDINNGAIPDTNEGKPPEGENA